jgi:uncharacterized membrane protein
MLSVAQRFEKSETLRLISSWWGFFTDGFAPASIVAPLGTVALVCNCVASPLLLGEEFRKRDWLGIGLTIVGTITS